MSHPTFEALSLLFGPPLLRWLYAIEFYNDDSTDADRFRALVFKMYGPLDVNAHGGVHHIAASFTRWYVEQERQHAALESME